jgi:hypothetical protein
MRLRESARQAFRQYRIEKKGQLESELDSYLDTFRIRSPQQSGPAAAVTIHGNVGAVQTGPGSVSNVVLQATYQDRLVRALDDLRAAVERMTDISNDQRQDVITLVDDAKTVVTAERRSGPRLYGS